MIAAPSLAYGGCSRVGRDLLTVHRRAGGLSAPPGRARPFEQPVSLFRQEEALGAALLAAGDQPPFLLRRTIWQTLLFVTSSLSASSFWVIPSCALTCASTSNCPTLNP